MITVFQADIQTYPELVNLRSMKIGYQAIQLKQADGGSQTKPQELDPDKIYDQRRLQSYVEISGGNYLNQVPVDLPVSKQSYAKAVTQQSRDVKTTITNNHCYEHINELPIRIICLISQGLLLNQLVGFQSSLSQFVVSTPFLLLYSEYPVNDLKDKEQNSFLEGEPI